MEQLTCTFFGHRNCPSDISSILYTLIESLITQHNVTRFYVGNQGNFDHIVRRTLRKIRVAYPHIQYAVVLAYMPTEKDNALDFSDTIFPEEIAASHPRYAISKRNRWMLQRSDYVIGYITHATGGAAQFASSAKAQGKQFINVADLI